MNFWLLVGFEPRPRTFFHRIYCTSAPAASVCFARILILCVCVCDALCRRSLNKSDASTFLMHLSLHSKKNTLCNHGCCIKITMHHFYASLNPTLFRAYSRFLHSLEPNATMRCRCFPTLNTDTIKFSLKLQLQVNY